MSVENLITNLFNIELDKIQKIDSVVQSDGSITVYIQLKAEEKKCKFCSRKMKIHGYTKRILTHSTLANRKCTIIYNQRRYICKDCNITFKEVNPFTNTSENMTIETKINVLKDLKYVNETYTSVARRYNLTVTQVQRIFDKHVNIPRKELPKVLSIDEHHFPESSYDSLYCCVLMNFEDGELVDVLPDRKKDYLISYFSNIKNETINYEDGSSELNNVKYISIDLYEPYLQIAQTYFPHATVCADPFHVLKHLNEGFRKVRLKCRRNTKDENLQYLLIKFKYIFNHGINLDNEAKYNKRFKRYMNYRDIMEILFYHFPELKTAYKLKESYMNFNTTSNSLNAKERLADQIEKFAGANIEEYQEFYNLMINWNKEIINSFSIINNRRINNSYIESRNSQIEKLFYNANGYKNFSRARNRIMYCINKNDTYKI